jgi:hypothetical protein
MKPASPGAKRLLFYCNAFFAFSVLAAILYILHLPLFPNGDGPVHIYYSHVMWSLVTHQPLYLSYYAIRHLVGIYSIHYFALILFEKFLSQAKAEELFVAIILANTALGFRFLAGRLGANAAVASLWMVPLLLSWPLGSGFLNYCFAIGMVYWALGFWIGLPPKGLAYGFIGYIAALLMVIFSHPVPLLFLAAFLAADLVTGWLEARRLRYGLFFRDCFARCAAFCLTCAALIVPSLLVEKSKLDTSLHDIYPHPHLLRLLLTGRCIGMFGGAHPLTLLYTAGQLILVPGVAFLMAKEAFARLRQGTTTAADRLLLFSLLLLVATLCFPDSLNGSDNFPQRFWILLWTVILACSSAATLQLRTLRWISAAGVILIGITSVVTVRTLSRAAVMQAEVNNLRLPSGRAGIFLEPWGTSHYPFGFTSSVFYSVGFRAAARSDAILLNSPWINQTHLPVEENGRSGLLDDYVSWSQVNPPRLIEIMSKSSATRDVVLRLSDFILYADPEHGAGGLQDAVHNVLKDEQPQWDCGYGSYFALCTKHSPVPQEAGQLPKIRRAD